MRSHWIDNPPLSPQDSDRLDQLYQSLSRESRLFLGYPCNQVFDYRPLYRFMDFPMNNVGDPFLASNYHLNTLELEREVLEIFRQLTQAAENEVWGYVTNGGTEGNHYGLFLARELFPEGMVYYSQDAHYSIDKILRALGLKNIMIRSDEQGRMDLDDLRETLRIHRDVPPILCVTIGTTMKGAVDDVVGIRQIFSDLAITRHYIHADAALGGMIMPFIETPPPWNFAAGIDSIAISGHKMIGSPMPCGVVLARKQYVDRIAQSVEYIDTLDTTLSGSRNAITPLFLWYAFHTVGIEGFQRMVPECLAVADYAIDQLNDLDRQAWRHPYSNTVVFDRPPQTLTHRWQLACQGPLSHLITMPHVTRSQIDQFIAEMKQSTAPLLPSVTAVAPCEAHIADHGEEIILVGGTEKPLLTDISVALASAGISIEALSAAKVDQGSVIRLQVSDRDRALTLLNQTLNGGRSYGQACELGSDKAADILSLVDYQAVSDEALLVELEDQAGSLATLMKQCRDQDIVIRSVRLLWRGKQRALVEIATSEPEKLRALTVKILELGPEPTISAPAP
ncbi:histidine decarboxylase [Lyngbya confervoides]|uniref:Histidine decarboxylase n=1 Tax=Lyngbya confervoides BDU141951 TaxID=1574623 RepID=A0ABD4T7J4_9CYAN|nr:histidine decarboxylase [Lyngbya confervoides]MCM1984547.1 histidine decarboxylase [Lyngbya confervoides BDU141951]